MAISIVIITLFLLILLCCRYCYDVGSVTVIANPVIMYHIFVNVPTPHYISQRICCHLKIVCKANGGTSAARVADKQIHSYLVNHVLVHYFLSGHTTSFLIIASPSQSHLEIRTSVPVGRNSSH